MLDFFFRGLFNTDISGVITVGSFLLCMGTSLLIGLILAYSCRYQGRYTKSFLVTLMLLPSVVCIIIMMVNGSVGAGVAFAGAFSLVRFRSAPGTGRRSPCCSSLWYESRPSGYFHGQRNFHFHNLRIHSVPVCHCNRIPLRLVQEAIPYRKVRIR